MAAALEKDGYQFRAELWSAPMKDDLGRAVRVQMFKGLEYQFCIAVSPATATGFSAVLLDETVHSIEKNCSFSMCSRSVLESSTRRL
jgi:hypothetical protein